MRALIRYLAVEHITRSLQSANQLTNQLIEVLITYPFAGIGRRRCSHTHTLKVRVIHYTNKSKYVSNQWSNPIKCSNRLFISLSHCHIFPATPNIPFNIINRWKKVFAFHHHQLTSLHHIIESINNYNCVVMCFVLQYNVLCYQCVIHVFLCLMFLFTSSELIHCCSIH